MKVGYIIEANDKSTNRIFSFLERTFIKIFQKLSMKIEEEKILLFVPKYKRRIPKGILKKIEKQLDKYRIKQVVLSKPLWKKAQLVAYLNETGKELRDGRYLFSCLSLEVLEFIAGQMQEPLVNQEICILLNNTSSYYKELVLQIATKVKRIKLVTNHIEQFRTVESELYDTLGIMMTLSNNKKKSLAKAGIILNMDFPEELVDKYTIGRNAILINLEEKVTMTRKNFNGIVISDYLLNAIEEVDDMVQKYPALEKNHVCEVGFLNLSMNEIKNKKDVEKMEIAGLVGNNGVIDVNDFLRIKKSMKHLTKT